MKRTLFLAMVIFFTGSCSKDSGEKDNVNYRQEMRSFVAGISSYAKSVRPGFLVIPQNGIELVTETGEPYGNPDNDYLSFIDGVGQEELFYGYDNKDDVPTPAAETEWIRSFLNLAKNAGKKILVSDYCYTPSKVDESY